MKEEEVSVTALINLTYVFFFLSKSLVCIQSQHCYSHTLFKALSDPRHQTLQLSHTIPQCPNLKYWLQYKHSNLSFTSISLHSKVLRQRIPSRTLKADNAAVETKVSGSVLQKTKWSALMLWPIREREDRSNGRQSLKQLLSCGGREWSPLISDHSDSSQPKAGPKISLGNDHWRTPVKAKVKATAPVIQEEVKATATPEL